MKRERGAYHERRQLATYGAGLKGLSHSQLHRQRGLKGTTLGPASEGRSLTAEERERIAEQMRREGKL